MNSSYTWETPVAPIGCPFAFSPPSGFTGSLPVRRVAPDSVTSTAPPGAQKPRSSSASSSAIVKQSCASTKPTFPAEQSAERNACSAARRLAGKVVRSGRCWTAS